MVMSVGVPFVATVLSDAALVIAAATPFVLSAAVFLLVWRKGFRHIHAKLAGMAVTLEGIDKAVNSVPAGMPALKDRIARIEATQDAHSAQIEAIRADLEVGFAQVRRCFDRMAARNMEDSPHE